LQAVEAKRKSMSALVLARLQEVSDKRERQDSKTFKSHRFHDGKHPLSFSSAKFNGHEGLYTTHRSLRVAIGRPRAGSASADLVCRMIECLQ